MSLLLNLLLKFQSVDSKMALAMSDVIGGEANRHIYQQLVLGSNVDCFGKPPYRINFTSFFQ
ncbi:MAG: hypothetical protein ACRCRW_10480 [Aeromonadaceae bacterium]